MAPPNVLNMEQEIHRNNKHDQLTADIYFFKNVLSRLVYFPVSEDAKNYLEKWYHEICRLCKGNSNCVIIIPYTSCSHIYMKE